MTRVGLLGKGTKGILGWCERYSRRPHYRLQIMGELLAGLPPELKITG